MSWRAHAAFAADPLAFLDAAVQAQGPVARIQLGRQRFVLLADPADVAAVLESEAAAFAKRRGKQLLGEGLLTSDGAFHDAQRALVKPAFHGARVAGLATMMAEEAVAEATRWPDGATVDVAARMSALALRMVGRALAGADLARHEATIADALHVMLGLSRRITDPWAPLKNVLPLPSNMRALAAKARLDRVVYGLIAERRAGPDQDDMLGMLLAARGADGRPAMGDRQVRDEALTLLLAGHETTGTALTWIWWLVASHPGVRARLAAEHAAVLGGRPPGAPDLPRLPYTRQVVKEAMRLYPPAWALWRNAQAPVRLPGAAIAAGEGVVLSPWVTHRHAAWWPDPTAFRPERWDGEEAAGRPRYAYFPFGGGMRGCLGEPFAWVGLVLAVAAMAPRVTLTAVAERPPLAPLITLRPLGGLPMLVGRA